MNFSNAWANWPLTPSSRFPGSSPPSGRRGADVVTFGIGDPDIPTPQPIIDRLLTASQDPPNHRYPETDGLPEMRRAIAYWYENRFGVSLDPDTEVLPLIGAKEGIGHAAFCFLDPGDLALVPDPAYPRVWRGNHVRRRGKPRHATV